MQRRLARALLLLATSVISAAVWPTYERTHWWSKARPVAVRFHGRARVRRGRTLRRAPTSPNPNPNANPNWSSQAGTVAYLGLSRLGFSIGVALLIWLCISGG